MRTKNASIVFLSIAELSLALSCALTVGLVRQKTSLRADVARAEAQRDVANAERDAAIRYPASAVPSDRVVRQELLGIQGSLKRLVFVLDKSGSMARGRKWDYTRGVVDTWLRYLEIEQCSLVVFDDNVTTFPSTGYLDLIGVYGARNRDSLLARLMLVQPGGNTNTFAALRTAYALDPTAIVLATDGFPDSGTNHFDDQMAERVAELLGQHGHSVPIHVLALGNYFQPRLGKFLWTIADTSGGTFIAR